MMYCTFIGASLVRLSNLYPTTNFQPMPVYSAVRPHIFTTHLILEQLFDVLWDQRKSQFD